LDGRLQLSSEIHYIEKREHSSPSINRQPKKKIEKEGHLSRALLTVNFFAIDGKNPPQGGPSKG